MISAGEANQPLGVTFGADLPPNGSTAKARQKGRHFTRVSSAEAVSQLISLEFSSLLRAISYASALHNLGEIWSRSEGTMQDYCLSEPVSRIDHFLSHTWSTPHRKKVMALTVFYNVVPASIAKVLLWLALTLAMNRPVETFVIVQVLWLVLLFTWHEIHGLFGSPRPAVFLDKACIHQVDPELKLKGINSLPAILAHSQRLVILYSGTYLNRLWTVYELAMYFLLHEGAEAQVHFLPVDVPLLPLILFEVVGAFASLCRGWWLAIPTILGNLLAALFCRWLADLQNDMLEQFSNFDIQAASCKHEEDRAVLEGNVEAFMKHSGLIAPRASTKETLSAFNGLVRESMPVMMQRSLGCVGVPFRFMLLAYTPGVMQAFAQFWARAWTGDPRIGACMEWTVSVCYTIGVCPISVAAGVYVARVLGARKGLAYASAIAAITVALSVSKWVLSAPLYLLALMLEAFPAWAVLGSVVYLCVLTLMNYAAFHYRGVFAGASRPCGNHSGKADAEAGRDFDPL